MAAREARSITVYGLTLIANGERYMTANGGVEFDAPADSVVSGDPFTFTGDMLDKLIASGGLKPGCFNGLRVKPPKDTWKDEWVVLKDD